MFGHCKGPLWGLDDFSQCFRLNYLQTLLPLIACAVSLLVLGIQLLLRGPTIRRYNAYHQVGDSDTVESASAVGQNGLRPYSDEDSASDDESQSNGFPALKITETHESVFEVNKPKGQWFVVAVEEAAVLAQLGVHLSVLLTRSWGRHGTTAASAQVAVWAFIATLTSIRLLFSSQSKYTFTRLWYHTTFLYCILWVFTVLTFRSAIIHPRSRLALSQSAVDFALTSLLALIALSSRKGNRVVTLEYEGELQPSREQTASLLSILTFSWIDGLIWVGYKRTLELKDVWNLVPHDKAAAVLDDYRQIKKTSSLSWHLLGHFRGILLIQASWAIASGLLTFAPTLLLKVILEYVEDPETIPRNAAWFYVILLFLSGSASALADGQALWIGRRICIRLRAIIVGEIYAKALKRRAAASANKVLGEDDSKKPEDEDKSKRPGLLKRAMTFGRKRKPEKSGEEQAADAAAKAKEDADAQVSSGTIINLMAVDSFKVSEICAYLHFLWGTTPVQFIVAIVLLYQILGYSSIVGIGMMIILLPINMYIAKQFTRIQKKILAATDARIHTTNEVLSNIRIIKFFAWEQRFRGLIDEKREKEITRIRQRYTVWAVAATVWSGAPVLITFLSFLVYTKIEHRRLIPSVAFTALSLFQILRIPLDQLADMVAHVQESKVSVDRIEEYLNEPETHKYEQLKKPVYDEEGNAVIGFDKGTFSWAGKDEVDSEAFTLRDLDVKFKPNQLNTIVGPTGSGKTSLLMALLGEMMLLEGKVHLPGAASRESLKSDPETGLTESVAYCAQQAWLVNANIKDNIVFASPWDPQRYKDVIVACSLQRDLEILDNGDQTLVGEKGVTLSGGQKQRISLARALYSKARYVLLDDVLSAVDSHTSKWIFDQALMGPLMYNRTCILVTHNISLCVPHSEFTVVLDNGRVVAQGTLEQVVESGKLGEDISKSKPNSRGPSRIASKVPSNIGNEEPLAKTLSKPANGHINGDANEANGFPVTNKPNPKDELEEKKAEGGVKLSIIFLYFKAMGPWWYWVLAALGFGAQQIASVGTNIWIREWANAYDTQSVSTMRRHQKSPVTHAATLSGVGSCLRSGTCNWALPWFGSSQQNVVAYASSTRVTMAAEEVNSDYYLTVYAIIGLGFMIITFVREIILFAGSISASRRIHSRLVEAVTRAKFRFFDSTPLGQIMNRFSKDIEAIDQEVAPIAIGVVHCLASIITIVILISVITPAFLIAGAFISVLYFLIGKFYINASRDLKRLESVQRSPIYQQFGETLSGMTTIRAYGDEQRFIRENLKKINTQSRPFIYLWAANRWLAFRVDIVGAMVAFFTGIFVVLSVGRIDAGAAGLAMTYAVTFTENVLWFVRLYAANEQNMNSVERIKEYLDVDQEAAAIVEDNRPPTNWPTKGGVEFIAYSTRYREDFDKVLKKVTFKILPGEKVGVVGRTGAGKSSLALALFRALEAEEGKILVDDVDIGLIGLQDLRESIVMVPQDPTLFTGTIRSNLDPFGLFTDEEIYTALRRVQLIGSPGPPSSTATPKTTRPSTPITKQSVPSTEQPSPSHADADASTSAATTVVDPTDLPIPASAPTPPENKNLFRNLNHPVAESGSNLSQGQRQLLCLARALLKNPTVLLMDEATASIDYATDAKIQGTIREIKNTTITIAHRLNTIIDYDKVLVLDRGEVIEYGSPWELVDSEGGVFRGMCDMSGEGEQLRELARKAEEESKRKRKLVDDE